MKPQLQIIPVELLEEYCSVVDGGLGDRFQQLTDAEISGDNFSFYTSVASVFSSKIEGEDIELDSYIKHKKFGVAFLPDYTKKIDDLYSAYTFAAAHELNVANISEAHMLLSKSILDTRHQGRLRTQHMYVSTPDGRIEYVAASPYELETEMGKFYSDIAVLLQQPLNLHEVFYFAAMIHLVFVKIHPWNDGNGRCARLLEKWFLAHHLGAKAWFVPSERHYYRHHDTYYKNIRALGLEYTGLDYSRALPFLLMLPQSITE